MCPQYRQRQTSELNEQGKNDIPVRCQGAYAKSRQFLRNLTEYIDIKTFFILYAFFLSEHRYIFSKKAR